MARYSEAMKRAIAASCGLLLTLGTGSAMAAQTSEPATFPPASPEASPSMEEGAMRLTSTAFEHEGDIPARFTCDGEDISPALSIEGLPAETVSLVLVMDDPDAPVGTWDHWVEYDIEPLTEIPEAVETLGTPGVNSWDRTGYGGPCPPSGTHRYFFAVYALDTTLGWEPGAAKVSVLGEIHDHILAEATLLGFYSRE